MFRSIDLTKEKAGLRLALTLEEHVDAIVVALQSGHLLHDVREKPARQVTQPVRRRDSIKPRCPAPTGAAIGIGFARLDVGSTRMTGINLIAEAHARLIADDGLSCIATDDGELAMAAACYAATEQLFTLDGGDDDCTMADPWPWARIPDLRREVGERRLYSGSLPADPATCTTAERVELLTRAGAMIAAELDRLLSMAQQEKALCVVET
ncbi:hypothetical protein [Caballeronia grimmiae]|uniref:hypothetical protein n=1 Tax=Caballeronia grimmiae TaxID=1071679 RepID=UPI001FD4427F|nr:hypothetical protein [Caballeronia grimmiae]